MSYDTEHVRNAGETPSSITNLPTFTELLDNTDLAALYTSIRRAETTTGPELVETTTVSKKTVYDYLHKLEQAGLISRVGDDAGTAVYAAEEFELTLTVRNTEVSITPELVEIIAHEDEYPVIQRSLNDHGLVTFALAYDLVNAHSEGEVTIRQMAELTGLSTGTTYDLVEAFYSILDLGGDNSVPTTYTPGDFDDEESNPLDELFDE
ncbi:transcriptional regulator [Haloarcula mannanilytica]|uniref:Transcriptional regulator n=1 Tax=Haloarcula mannanilytica TaxID=2509225 RepID=A0A4C2EC27_9EURY|nr:MarR family transcriptional regulator [Haloarcula mannanilytica]GCF12068.1 transcriptional regulator [Haloarcula mannanilytica]